MSVTSRYRERKYNVSDNDRLSRILSQPVQAWEKKWAPSARSKTFQVHKWVKSDRTIVFEDDEDDQDMSATDRETSVAQDDSAMDVDQEPKAAYVDSTALQQLQQQQEQQQQQQQEVATAGHEDGLAASMTTQDAQHEIKAEPASARSPVAPMPSLTTPTMKTEAAPVVAVNKQVSSLVEEEDDSRTPTPKLSDVSDADPDAMLDDDDDDDKSNDLNDASQHPAYAPHVHPRLTDDEQIDSLATSEQTSTVATPQTDSFAPSAASSQPPLGHSQTGQIDQNEQIDPIDQNEQSQQNDQDPPSPVASQTHHHHVDPVAAPVPAAPVEQAAPSPPEPEIAAIAQPAPEQPLQPIPTTAASTTDTDVPMAESQNEHQPTA